MKNGERGEHILFLASFRSFRFGFVASAVNAWYILIGAEALRSAGRAICSGKAHLRLDGGGLAEAATGPPVPPSAARCFTGYPSRGVVDPTSNRHRPWIVLIVMRMRITGTKTGR